MPSPFDTGTQASNQWATLAHCLDEALDESHPLELMVELLERQEMEERDNDGSQSTGTGFAFPAHCVSDGNGTPSIRTVARS